MGWRSLSECGDTTQSRLRDILHYSPILTSFVRQMRPLVNVDSNQTTVIEKFNKKWKEGEAAHGGPARQLASVMVFRQSGEWLQGGE